MVWVRILQPSVDADVQGPFNNLTEALDYVVDNEIGLGESGNGMQIFAETDIGKFILVEDATPDGLPAWVHQRYQ